MAALRRIDLSHNQLRILPAALGELPALGDYIDQVFMFVPSDLRRRILIFEWPVVFRCKLFGSNLFYLLGVTRFVRFSILFGPLIAD